MTPFNKRRLEGELEAILPPLCIKLSGSWKDDNFESGNLSISHGDLKILEYDGSFENNVFKDGKLLFYEGIFIGNF